MRRVFKHLEPYAFDLWVHDVEHFLPADIVPAALERTIFVAVTCAILIGIFLLLLRAFAGPTSFDRILATNAMGTKTVIFVALLGFISKRPEFLDTALAYAIINFVSTIAILKFIEFKRIG